MLESFEGSLFDAVEVEIVALLASPLHRYEGRPDDGPRRGGDDELRDSLDLRASLGIVGDRYFNQRAHRAASVTLQSIEALEAVAAELDVPVPGLRQTRRNILLRGVDVDALARTAFSLDSGAGAVRFEAGRPANPRAWMNSAIVDGAHRALRGRGGIRTGPLNDGTLSLGPALLRILGG